MGTKRGASLNLSDADGTENKRQNLNIGIMNTETIVGEDVPLQQNGGDGPANGGQKQTAKPQDDSDFAKIKEDLMKLKIIAKNQRDEIRDSIMAIPTNWARCS